MEPELKDYYKQISRTIKCPAKQKRAFLNDFKNTVEEFVQSNDSATMERICGEFGTPREIADSFNSLNGPTAERKLRLRKWLFVFLAIALFVYIIFVAACFIDVHEEAHGWFAEGVMAIINLKERVCYEKSGLYTIGLIFSLI